MAHGLRPPSGESQRAMSQNSTTSTTPDPATLGDYGDAYPRSSKVYLATEAGVRVPMRRIALSGGEPSLDVYDTSGPLGHDVRDGLPELRRDWIRGRAVTEVERAIPPASGSDMSEALQARTRRALRGTGPVTQLYYARKGEITPEMHFIATREGLAADFVRDEVARGRAIIPANINHPELEPMTVSYTHLTLPTKRIV